MGKLSATTVIIFLVVIALFSVYNNDSTTITVPFGETVEVSKIGVILVSAVFGALTIFIVFMVRDSMRFMVSYQNQRIQRRSEKVSALYNSALNDMLGENLASARASLEQILKMDPTHTDSLLRLGNMDAGSGDHESAAAYYMKAMGSSGNNIEALFALSEVMARMERLDEAIGHVDEILQIDPNNHSALIKKRELLERDERWDDLIDVQRSMLRTIKDPEAKTREQTALLGYRYEVARESLESGDLTQAERGFKDILGEDHSFEPAHLGLAEVLLARDESEGAADYLEKTYESTRSRIILARLEDLLIRLGDPMRIIRLTEDAAKREPDNPEARFFLGKLYYRLEMVDDALRELGGMEESFPEVHMLLGELYLRRQQCEKAAGQFKKTLELKKALRVPYRCQACGHKESDWSGRCPNCGGWATFRLGLSA